MTDKLRFILSKLQTVKRQRGGYVAICPAHDDTKPSLSISQSEEGKILIHCHAGCDTAQIMNRLGLDVTDLFPKSLKNLRSTTYPKEEICYSYTDENGELLYQALRLSQKAFRQRRPLSASSADWIWDLKGVRRVPYRLTEIIRESKRGGTVFIVEGEKDADNLVALGLVATTNSGGAGKWLPEFGQYLKAAHVVVLPDNDAPGLEHARQVAQSCRPYAASLKVLPLPNLPSKGDVSDWLQSGGTAKELLRLVDSCEPFSLQSPALASNGMDSCLPPLNVVALSDVISQQVSWLWAGRIPFGKITLIDGDPGQGKTTMITDLAARLSRGACMPGESDPIEPGSALLISVEDGAGDTLRPRAEAAEASLDRVFILLGVPERRDDGTSTERPFSLPQDIYFLQQLVQEKAIRLVVIDPLMAVLTAEINSYRDQDVRRALTPLAHMAETTGAAVVVLRHLSKARGLSAMHRGGGSVGIIGAARSALLVARDPDDPERRVVASIKSNLGPEPDALTFKLCSVPGSAPWVEWGGRSTHTADALVSQTLPEGGVSALDEAVEFLRELLADGPIAATAVKNEAKEAGISEITLNRAKSRLGIKPEKVGNLRGPSHWQWALPVLEQTKMITQAEDAHLPESDHLRDGMITFRDKEIF